MIRCSQCKKDIIEETKYQDWLALMNFLEFLLSEEYIGQQLHDSMQDKLMTFKRYTTDDDTQVIIRDDKIILSDETDNITKIYDVTATTEIDDFLDTFKEILYKKNEEYKIIS